MEDQYMTVGQACDKWHVSKSTVRRYCLDYGEFIGAYKDVIWKIPTNAFPPYHVRDLKQFLEEHLKAVDRSRQLEGWEPRKVEYMWNCLRSANLAVSSEDTHQYYVTDQGWDLLLGRLGSQNNRYASIALGVDHLIEFNLLNVGAAVGPQLTP